MTLLTSVVTVTMISIRTKLRRDGGEIKPNDILQRLGPDYVSVRVYA